MPQVEQYPTVTPDFGGLDSPYTDVPHCGFYYQNDIRRAVLAPSGVYFGDPLGPGISPDSPLVQNLSDPLDEHVSLIRGYNYIGQSGIIGLCQMPLIQNPSHYGLFWIMQSSPNPMAALQGMSLPTDASSMVKTDTVIRNNMPESILRCAPTEEESRRIAQLWEEATIQGTEMNQRYRDPYLEEEASYLADHLVIVNGLIDIDDEQFSILTDTVAFSLQQGISEDELGSIASELSKISLDIRDFLYGMITICSLRVAERLNWENRHNGFISPDFGEFTSSVEDAMLRGQIFVQILDMAQSASNPGMIARYDNRSNSIQFPPISDKVSIEGMFVTILHECWHAFQDKKAVPMTVLQAEMEAYSTSEKAGMLLSMEVFPGGATNVLNSDANDALNAYYEAVNWMTEETKECMNIPEKAVQQQAEDAEESAMMHQLWQVSLYMELIGDTETGSDLLFHEYYKYVQSDGIVGAVEVASFMNAAYAYDAGRFYGLHLTTDDIMSSIQDFRKILYDISAGPDRDQELYGQIDWLVDISSIIYFTDPDLREFMFLEMRKDAPAFREALLASIYNFDGI